MRVPSQQIGGGHDPSTAMTPMIDIVFLLLIFFVIAAAGAVQEKLLATDLAASGGVDSDLPPAEPEDWKVEIWLKLRRDPAGGTVVEWNGTPYSDREALERQLRALAAVEATNPVILDVGPGAPWGEVIDVYDRCRRAGLLSVHFAVDAPPAHSQ